MGFPDGLFEAFTERYANELARINTRYLTAMAERIGEIGRLKRVDFHRLERLRAYGSDYEEMKRELAALTGRTERAIQALIEAAAVESYGEMERLSEMTGRPLIPYAENAALQATADAIARQTAGTFRSLSNTSAIGYAVHNSTGAIVFRGAGEAYRDAIDRAIHEVTMGLTDPAAAIRQTLKDLADSGLRQVDYASGRHRRLDSAVRMNVLDGMRQVYQGIQDELGDRIGADGVELSAHGSCAPDHLPYQGRQFSLKAFDELQSSLDRPFGMWNCRHSWKRIILGVSVPAYSDAESAELRRLSTELIEFEGKEMTRYEATQLQRRIETGVRAAKDRANIAATAGDDVWRRAEQLRINQLTAKYQELSEAAGLPTQRERMSVGRPPIPGGHKLRPALTSPHVRRTGTIAASWRTRGFGGFRPVSAAVKTPKLNIPPSVYTKSLEHPNDTQEILPGLALSTVRNKLVGSTTINGIEIKDVAEHFLARTAERVIPLDGAIEALTNPLHINPVAEDEKGKSQRFIGNRVTMNINPETGRIITGWLTGSRTRKKYGRKQHENN